MHLKYDYMKSIQHWRLHEFRTTQELNQALKAACQDSFVMRYHPAAFFSLSLFPPYPVKRNCFSLLPGIPQHWDARHWYRSPSCLKEGLSGVKYTKDCRVSSWESVPPYHKPVSWSTHCNLQLPKKEKSNLSNWKIRQFNKIKYTQEVSSYYPSYRNTSG